jgi:hypothetical protein
VSLSAPLEAQSLPLYCSCPARLFLKQQAVVRHSAVDKAARFCLLLVWLKLIDWETDRPNLYVYFLRRNIERKIRPILAELSPPTRQLIDAYLLLIRAQGSDFNSTVKMSGLLAQATFEEIQVGCRVEDAAHSALSDIFLLVGELIPIADALLDLAQDLKDNQYNPIVQKSQRNKTSLEEEYRGLAKNYHDLQGRILALVNAGHPQSPAPVFRQIMQQSLANLSAKISRNSNALFAAQNGPQPRQQNRRRQAGRDCCDCCDCCECGLDCFQGGRPCCCASGETFGGGVEAGSCCECGCCDVCNCAAC